MVISVGVRDTDQFSTQHNLLVQESLVVAYQQSTAVEAVVRRMVI